MIIFAQMVAADRIQETMDSIAEIKIITNEDDITIFDRFVIVVNETKNSKIDNYAERQLKSYGCEVYKRYWNDNFPDARNAYLEKIQNDDWVVVSDSDEKFDEVFLRDVRYIITQAEKQKSGLLLINSHDVWLENSKKVDEIQSNFYKNLIYQKKLGVHYVGVGQSKTVHEELVLPPNTITIRLANKYFYRHTKEKTVIWERAARNVFIGGGGNNVGVKNTAWVELRKICSDFNINSWEEFKKVIENEHNLTIEDWIINHRKKGDDWENEMVDMFLWYKHLHPNYTYISRFEPIEADNQRSTIMQQVEELYLQVLGRHADQPGKEFYTAAIETGKTTLDAVRQALINSDEYKRKQYGLEQEEVLRVGNVKVDVDLHLTDEMVYQTMIKKSQFLRTKLMSPLRLGRKMQALLLITKKIESGGEGNDFSESSNFEPLITTFKEICPPSDYRMVLNIGAGAGVETNLLKEAGYTAIGITYGKDNIKYAKEHFNIELKEMDMQDLIFPSNIFDATFSCQAFEHSFSAWWHILEMRRVLRDGGRVFIDVPDPDDDAMLRTIWHTEVLYPNQIKALFWKAGFKEVKDLSVKHRLAFCFEKLPDNHPDFTQWGYVKYIMQELQNI